MRKGLKNLIFMFGTNQVNYDEVAPPLTYYPGAAWADMVSIDIYDEELDLAGSPRGLRHYTALIGTGKPFGISEFGQSFEDNGTGANGAAWDARTLTTANPRQLSAHGLRDRLVFERGRRSAQCTTCSRCPTCPAHARCCSIR